MHDCMVREIEVNLSRGMCITECCLTMYPEPHVLCLFVYHHVIPRCSLRSAPQTNIVTGRRTAAITPAPSSTSAPFMSSSLTSCSTCSWVSTVSPRPPTQYPVSSLRGASHFLLEMLTKPAHKIQYRRTFFFLTSLHVYYRFLPVG